MQVQDHHRVMTTLGRSGSSNEYTYMVTNRRSLKTISDNGTSNRRLKVTRPRDKGAIIDK